MVLYCEGSGDSSSFNVKQGVHQSSVLSELRPIQVVIVMDMVRGGERR